jgi:hypothetical protein
MKGMGLVRKSAVALMAVLLAFAGESHSGGRNDFQLYSGFFNFDLMGVGTENHPGLGYAYSLNRSMALKSSASFVNTHQQYAVEIPYLIPELGFELGREFGILKPSIGGGAGIIDVRGRIPDSVSYVVYVDSGNRRNAQVQTAALAKDNRVDASFYGEAGLKFKLPSRATYFNASVKVRAHEAGFSGPSSEVSIGIGSLF